MSGHSNVPLSVNGALRAARARFPGGHDNPRLDAEVLLAHVLGRDRAWLIAHAHDDLTASQRRRYEGLVERRIGGEPVAYLTGLREFWSLDLHVNREVLIPRPETELLVEAMLGHLRRFDTTAAAVADLGTGSGAIAVALASELPDTRVTATDCSPALVKLARENARRHGLGNLHFLVSDWCAALAAGHYPIICANPPYIADTDPHLDQGDVRFEPRAALCAGHDGLRDLRRIIDEARRCLTDHGYLFVEHGADQGPAVRHLFAKQDYREIRTLRDLAGHERVTLACSCPGP